MCVCGVMSQVRNGLAMARVLDRIFVLPELVCICDRWFNLLPNCTSGEVRPTPAVALTLCCVL